MRRNVTGVVAAIAVLGMTGTAAADGSDSMQLNLEGELPRACEIATSDASIDRHSNLDLTSTASQGGTQIAVTCNYGSSAMLTFDSLNGGKLVRVDGSEEVNYQASMSTYFANEEFDGEVVVPSFDVITNEEQSRTLDFNLTETAAVAGTYTDIVTVTVTPN